MTTHHTVTSQPERTLVLIKPAGVERQLVGQILARFEATDLAVTALEIRHPEQHHIEEHYAEHREESFFDPLFAHLIDNPVVATVLSGTEAISRTRSLVGATDPSNAAAETIRGDFGVDSPPAADAAERALRNLVHASANAADAAREIQLWFPNHEPR